MLTKKRSIPFVTYLLILTNLIFFYQEISTGGSENIENLYRLGGLVPEEVWLGEWWRLLTANFLHYGWFHLISNLIGLYYLGSLIESYLGKVRYMFVYFLSGIGAMFFFTIITIKMNYPNQILIGASASIMGLVGALFVIVTLDWFSQKSKLTTRRFLSVIFIIVLQSIFDYFIPEISGLSHILGLAIGGFVCVVLLALSRK